MNHEGLEISFPTPDETGALPQEVLDYVLQMDEVHLQHWLGLSDVERAGVLEQVAIRAEEVSFIDPEVITTILSPLQTWGEALARQEAMQRYPEVHIDERLRQSLRQLAWEAPSDGVQAQEGAEFLRSHSEFTPERWREMPFEQRVVALRALETSMAAIQHRQPCEVVVAPLGENTRGAFTRQDYRIYLSESLLRSNRPDALGECLRTTLHEGRHAYQDFCLRYPYTHPDTAMLREWRENCTDYITAQRNGFRAYHAQAIEADARAHAERVLQHAGLAEERP